MKNNFISAALLDLKGGKLKFEEASTNLLNCLPPSSIIIDAKFYKTVNGKECQRLPAFELRAGM